MERGLERVAMPLCGRVLFKCGSCIRNRTVSRNTGGLFASFWAIVRFVIPTLQTSTRSTVPLGVVTTYTCSLELTGCVPLCFSARNDVGRCGGTVRRSINLCQIYGDIKLFRFSPKYEGAYVLFRGGKDFSVEEAVER